MTEFTPCLSPACSACQEIRRLRSEEHGMASDYMELTGHLAEILKIVSRPEYRRDGDATRYDFTMGPGVLRFSMDLPGDVLDQMGAKDES